MSRISSLATQIRAVNPTDMEDYDDPNLGTGGSRKGSPFDIHGQFRNALAPRGGIAFDGTAAARGSVALTGQDIAADPFTFVVVFKVRAAVSINNLAILSYDATGYNRGSAAGRYGVTLNVTSAGSLQLQVIDSGWVESVPILYSGFVSAYLGKIVIVAATRNALYVNGLQVATGTFTGSVDSSYFVVGRHAAGGYAMTGEMYSESLYNYELSAADILEIYESGSVVPQRHHWGSQNLVPTDLTTYLKGNVSTVTKTVTDPFGVANNAYAVTPTTAGQLTNIYWNMPVQSTGTGLFKCRVWLRSQTNTPTFRVMVYRYPDYHSVDLNLSTTWTQYTIPTYTAGPNSSFFTFYLGQYNVGWIGNDVVEMYKPELIQLGAVVHLTCDDGVGYQLLDASANKLHAIVYNQGITHMVPAQAGRVRYTTSTNGNQQILGQQALPANARIRSWVIDTAGTPTVKLGNASGGAQFFASAALTAGLNDITLLTRFCSTNNLWVNSATTDALLHTIDYEIVD